MRTLSLFSVMLSAAAAMAALPMTELDHPELQKLLGSALGSAHRILEKQGWFPPFAVILDRDGHTTNFVQHRDNGHPNPAELREQLRRTLRAKAESGKILASARVYVSTAIPARESRESKVVIVELDHRDGTSLKVIYPWFSKLDETVTFEEPYRDKGRREIFPIAASGEPGGAADRSQPSSTQTNRASGAAGSGR